MSPRLVPLISIVIFLLACHRGPKVKLKPLDLNAYGINLTIMVPDSAEIVKKDYAIMRDITIQKGDWYYVQIFESETTSKNPEDVKRDQLESVKQDKYFKEMTKEDEHGFIFQKELDNAVVDYDFRYIMIIDDQEIIFQTGLIGTFTLEDVERMYESVSKN